MNDTQLARNMLKVRYIMYIETLAQLPRWSALIMLKIDNSDTNQSPW